MVCLASSVELLPGEGQAHDKMDCTLTPAFIGSRWRIRGAHQHLAKQIHLTMEASTRKMGLVC